ncbi:uncharacterized protein LOC132314736 [Cornus florida]|uniref:uncharacterized protein LOC132314736 n=1 Tax=Cornus florida TaxID=4283 RepID=UPI002898B985|nr:uncharacterized protein LOC132314736 [Cornus florida]
MNHYEVLGLKGTANKEEIQKAFRELAMQFHPDKHTQSSKSVRDHATRRFKQINDAYEVLIEHHKHADYNQPTASGGGGGGYSHSGYDYGEYYHSYRSSGSGSGGYSHSGYGYGGGGYSQTVYVYGGVNSHTGYDYGGGGGDYGEYSHNYQKSASGGGYSHRGYGHGEKSHRYRSSTTASSGGGGYPHMGYGYGQYSGSASHGVFSKFGNALRGAILLNAALVGFAGFGSTILGVSFIVNGSGDAPWKLRYPGKSLEDAMESIKKKTKSIQR